MTNQVKRIKRHARIRSKISGTAERPRLCVYRSLTSIYAQLIDDVTGKTLISIHDLKGKTGTKTESAKKVGEEVAKAAIAAKITECVFDRNGYKYHGRVKALADGAREGGLKF
jgi:large subunit ribosomal protein L18